MKSIIDMSVMLILGMLYGCGMGGGGLLVVYLTMFCGMAQTDAQALNLFYYVVASTAAAFVILKHRNVNYSLVTICSLAGIPGAYAGSLLRKIISVTMLRHIFGVVLIITGVSVFISKQSAKSADGKAE